MAVMEENLGSAEVLHLVQHRELPHLEPAVTPKRQPPRKDHFQKEKPYRGGHVRDVWSQGGRVLVRGSLEQDTAVGHHRPPCSALSRLPPLYHFFPQCLQVQCGTTCLDLT